ncbi:MAG: YihY/virulence factor BrkB family protein [Cytophagales bacterium]|nr:MAG: YihY/virulence factor BrkB family protein [Cytophagales bacterium]TAF60880.1 MAG: YihY/virulence factor BrkB family protein [Cytophagales bacterium]
MERIKKNFGLTGQAAVFISGLCNWLENRRFGVERVPAYTVLYILFGKIKKESLGLRAKAVAFNATLAIFPFVIFLFTLIAYLPIKGVETVVFYELQQILMPDIYEALMPFLEDLLKNRRGGLLSFGFAMAIFTATDGVMSVMGAFNHSYKVIEKRNMLRQRSVALILTLMLSVMFIVMIGSLLAGEIIMGYLVEQNVLKKNLLFYSITALRFLLAFGALYFSLLFIYYFGPSVQHKFKQLRAGALLSAMAIFLVTAAFSYYVVYVINFQKIYGSIGTLIGFMLWLHIASYSLLLGFEMNVSVQTAKSLTHWLRKQEDEDDFVVGRPEFSQFGQPSDSDKKS